MKEATGQGNSDNRDLEAGAWLPRVMDSMEGGGPGLVLGNESGGRGDEETIRRIWAFFYSEGIGEPLRGTERKVTYFGIR